MVVEQTEALEAIDAPAQAETAEVEDKDKLQWYAVHAYSNCEAQVQRNLLERIERYGKAAEFGSVEVPSEMTIELRGGEQKEVRRKTFPGYVLVQMKWSEENWHLVRGTPKVLGFIGGEKNKPEAIPDQQIEAILHQAEEGQTQPRVKTIYEPGQIVRVIEGPFNDFSGVVEEANHDKGRLRVAIQIFGRSTPVDLNFDQVTKD